jgi:hypothetical protein
VCSIQAIADALKVKWVVAQGYVKEVRQQWRIEQVEAFSYAKEQEYARLDKIEEQAWIGWNRSLEDSVKTITGRGKKPIIERVPQSGDPRFLTNIEKCVESRRKMLGLDEPIKVDMRAQIQQQSIEIKKLVVDNETNIEFLRQKLIGGPAPQLTDSAEPSSLDVPSIPGDGSERGSVEANKAFDDSGRNNNADGNMPPAITVPSKPVRVRPRLD